MPNSDRFDKSTVTAYWRTEAEEALTVAKHLMEKEDYAQAQMARIEETIAWLRSRLT